MIFTTSGIINQKEFLWATDTYCGGTWGTGAGGHMVLLVGYNDDDVDPSKHYWIIVNSWGATSGRRTGLFRLPMQMNYNCTYNYAGNAYYSRQFMTLNAATPACSYTITSTTPVNLKSTGGSAVVKIEASKWVCPAPNIPQPVDPWLSYSNLVWKSGKGTGTVKVTALPNTSSIDRIPGTVAIGDATLTVNQTGKLCTFGALTPRRGRSAATLTQATPSQLPLLRPTVDGARWSDCRQLPHGFM